MTIDELKRAYPVQVQQIEAKAAEQEWMKAQAFIQMYEPEQAVRHIAERTEISQKEISLAALNAPKLQEERDNKLLDEAFGVKEKEQKEAEEKEREAANAVRRY